MNPKHWVLSPGGRYSPKVMLSPPSPACPHVLPVPCAVLTAGEGDAGQGLGTDHGSRHHHAAEQAEGGCGHGGGRRGCPPRGSQHRPCGKGEGWGWRCQGCVSQAEMRGGKAAPGAAGGPRGAGISSCAWPLNMGESASVAPQPSWGCPHARLGSPNHDPPGTGASRRSCFAPTEPVPIRDPSA